MGKKFKHKDSDPNELQVNNIGCWNKADNFITYLLDYSIDNYYLEYNVFASRPY